MSKGSKHGTNYRKMRDHELRNRYGRQFKDTVHSVGNVGLENLARELGVTYKGESEGK